MTYVQQSETNPGGSGGTETNLFAADDRNATPIQAVPDTAPSSSALLAEDGLPPMIISSAIDARPESASSQGVDDSEPIDYAYGTDYYPTQSLPVIETPSNPEHPQWSKRRYTVAGALGLAVAGAGVVASVHVSNLLNQPFIAADNHGETQSNVIPNVMPYTADSPAVNGIQITLEEGETVSGELIEASGYDRESLTPDQRLTIKAEVGILAVKSSSDGGYAGRPSTALPSKTVLKLTPDEIREASTIADAEYAANNS